MNKFYYVLTCLVLFQIQIYAQFNWQSTGGPEGIVNPFLISNDSITLIPDEEFLYRTNDGIIWEAISHPVSLLMALYHDTLVNINFDKDPSAGHIQISFDFGDTWIIKDIPNALDHDYSNIALCSHGLYIYRFDTNLLYRSTDLGDSWNIVAHPGASGLHFFAMDERLFMQDDRNLAMSDLDGKTWKKITPPLHNERRILDVVAEGTHILVYDRGDPFPIQGSIWHSDDNGLTWEDDLIQTDNSGSDNVMHKAGSKIYAVVRNNIIQTEDFGVSWDTLTRLEGIKLTWGIGSIKDELLYATNQALYRWDTGTQQLVESKEGLTKGAIWDLSMTSEKIWSAGSTGIYNYDIGSGVWSEKMDLPIPYWPNTYNRISTNDLGWIAVSNIYELFFYLSVDNGLTWDTIYLNPNLLGVFELNLLGENIIILSDVTIRSTDKGEHWDYLYQEKDLIQTNIVFFKGHHYMAGQELLYSSPDNGITWDEIIPPFKIWALGTYGDDMFAVTYENNLTTLYISRNGIEWTYASDGFPINYPVSSFDYKGRQLFYRDHDYYYVFNADFAHNTYRSSVDPISWSIIPTPKLGSDLLFTPEHIYLGGEGLFKTVIENPFITGISEEPKDSKEIFTLSPNPAKNTIHINFNSDNSKGYIQLFTSNGFLIKSLMVNRQNEELDISELIRGSYHVVFSGASGGAIGSFVKVE